MRVRSARCRRASATSRAVSATSVRVRIASLNDADRQACAVKTTSSSGCRRRGAHARRRTRQSASDARETIAPARTRTPAGSAAVAASMYFCTLSVENCGAIGMPIDARHAGGGELGERVLDERPPVAHPDRDGHAGPRRARSASACAQRDVGQRRASADRRVVVRASPRRARRTAAVRRARSARYAGISSSDDGVPCAIRRRTRGRGGSRRHCRPSSGARSARAPARARPASTAGCRGRD